MIRMREESMKNHGFIGKRVQSLRVNPSNRPKWSRPSQGRREYRPSSTCVDESEESNELECSCNVQDLVRPGGGFKPSMI